MVMVRVWAKPVGCDGEEIEVGIEYSGMPAKWIRKTLGSDGSLAAEIAGSYDEFYEKYKYLYVSLTAWGLFSDRDDEKRVFNINMFTEYSSNRYTLIINMVERGITKEDIEEAFREIMEVVEKIMERYKKEASNYRLEREIVVEKEFIF